MVCIVNAEPISGRHRRRREELVMNRQWSSGYWIADNQATWDERASIHLRDANGFYAVERFRRGENIMMAIESAEIGNVAGRHLLNLQCHIGRCAWRAAARLSPDSIFRAPRSRPRKGWQPRLD